ncbi:MAG: hypothetical protein KDB92_03835, partial [Chitinophagaceae bacterium]|nr:hypothetical protein [Chitinophagaceae bacterium]
MNEQVNKNKTLQRINVLMFVGLLTVGGIASLIPQKQTISKMENRRLTPMPVYSDSAFWSGGYFRGLELYYADNFPLRNKWINTSENFRHSLGFQSTDIKIYEPENDAEANEIADHNDQDTTKKKVIQSGPLPDDGEVGVIKKRVFVFKDRAFEMFGGGPAMGKSYAKVINEYNRLLSPGIQIYNLIIPVAL